MKAKVAIANSIDALNALLSPYLAANLNTQLESPIFVSFVLHNDYRD